MNNISFNDFLDGFDLPAFTSAGGDWELLKTILKNAATTGTSSSSTVSINKNEDEDNDKLYYGPLSSSINNTTTTDKSEEKKKSYDYTDASTCARAHSDSSSSSLPLTSSTSTPSSISKEDERRKSLYTTIVPDFLKETEKKEKINSKEVKTNSTSFEVSSNDGIRAFLFGLRKRLPNTVKFIDNVMGDEGNYHDFIYKELSDEVLDSIIENLDKEMKKYNSLLTCFKDQDN